MPFAPDAFHPAYELPSSDAGLCFHHWSGDVYGHAAGGEAAKARTLRFWAAPQRRSRRLRSMHHESRAACVVVMPRHRYDGLRGSIGTF